MPRGLRAVTFHVKYKGHSLKIQLKDGRLRVFSADGDAAPISLRMEGQAVMLAPGETRSFRMKPGQEARRS
ncbi:glycosyl hydrolase family 65 protein [Paenarthrobacter sp. 4246]|uniref:glycosyl hydrolase family 65 protein n=1 Tax=Paenarthrobacter sp. 4246 TaxID=3156456 RepID=UPI00339776D2